MADRSYRDEILAAEFEEMKLFGRIGETIMSTPPHKNIIAQSPTGSGKSAAQGVINLPREEVHGLTNNCLFSSSMADLCSIEEVEEIKDVSSIGATMSTPLRININFQSPIGSGESTALLKAIIQLVNPALECPQVIFVVPNEESVIQISDLLLEMGNDIPLHQKPPVEAQVIIATPVMISNWIEAGKLDIDDMKMVLIDDLDRVWAEPGFKDCVVRIMKDISKRRPQCQVIMCSTDDPSKVMVIIDELLDLIAAPGQTIVFVDTRDHARMLFERLQGNRFVCKTLDGADTQDQRDKILEEFKEKRFQVLISTKILDWMFDPSHVLHLNSTVQTVTAGDMPYTSAARFEELKPYMSAARFEELLKGLYVGMQFERPSKVQSITLPMILSPPYKSLVVVAQNGSGKATCFVLGMLNRVDPKVVAPQAICICPTRELAIQNMEVLQKMGKFTVITSELATRQESTPGYTRPPVTTQVVIGTPDTINEWILAKILGTSCLNILVFDEADHMLAESGFKDVSIRMMTEIVKRRRDCQVLLFSATFNDKVKACVSKFFTELEKKYNQLYAEKELSLGSVKQYKVKVPDESSKIMVIKKVMRLAQKLVQAIIFVRTRQSAYDLHKALGEDDYPVTAIQGARHQEERDTIVKEFKDGSTMVLISSDLLARGFDQPQVNLVVNYDLPVNHTFPTEPDNDMYLHRIGRAGRFGRKGAVFNLLCGETDDMIMEKIERHHFVAEVPSWESEEDFEDALKKAQLL